MRPRFIALMVLVAAGLCNASSCREPALTWHKEMLPLSDGRTVSATLIGEGLQKPMVLLLMTKKKELSVVDHLANLMAQSGIAVMKLDLSEGSELADEAVQLAVTFAQENGLWNKKNLTLLGAEAGADLAIRYAAGAPAGPVTGLILMSPVGGYEEDPLRAVAAQCKIKNALLIATTGDGRLTPLADALGLPADKTETVKLIGDLSGFPLVPKSGRRRPTPREPYTLFATPDKSASPQERVDQYNRDVKTMNSYPLYNVQEEIIAWLKRTADKNGD